MRGVSVDGTRRQKSQRSLSFPPSRPVNSLANRMKVLSALSCVDWVTPFSEDTPERLICKLLPDVLVKGGDYRARDVAGYGCVTKNGGEVKILPFVDGLSTTNVINAIKQKS